MSDTTLLILSDSHGRPDRIREAIRRTHPDGILFAGDGLRDLTDCDLPCPLWAVKGNCDFSTPLIVGGALLEANSEELFTLAGIRILLTHGHHDQVKGGLGLLAAHGAACAADLVVFGHTHIPMEYRLTPDSPAAPVGLSKPMILFNPGSLGDREASFGTLTIRNGQMLPGHGNL